MTTNTFAGMTFINSLASLPPQFYTFVKPTPVTTPKLIKLNHRLARELGLDIKTLETDKGTEIFSGNTVPSTAMPLAQAYAGHQFGHFNPQLGDGRAILLGDMYDNDRQLKDIQLKGAGPTPYSRSGDGRAAIGPIIREYILSEAMHYLNIKTTLALAIVTTGDSVYRQTAQDGAIITRVASSHIRIGTFEYFRSQQSTESIKLLADFVIERHYPKVKQADNPYLELLNEVINAQAQLIASWMNIGFIHGVMNTDNMSISGETIDYGPCAFMDEYRENTAFSSIDHNGRYAYGNQPKIALWNLTRFAECLLPLLDEDMDNAVLLAEHSLGKYADLYQEHWLMGMRAKLGLLTAQEGDDKRIKELLEGMEANQIDFTNFFRQLSGYLAEGNESHQSHPMSRWITDWKMRVLSQPTSVSEAIKKMNSANPAYIPRNHLVEEAITAAEQKKDYQLMEDLMSVLATPFKTQDGKERYTEASPATFKDYRTFCGT